VIALLLKRCDALGASLQWRGRPKLKSEFPHLSNPEIVVVAILDYPPRQINIKV
jgi:hypothetical protein